MAATSDFMTGQGARVIIGQRNFTDQDIGTPSQTTLGAVSGIAYANNMLFVVDSNHIQATPVQNRVLIYHNLATLVPPANQPIPQGTRCPVCLGNGGSGKASVVVGQPDFTSGDINLTANGFQNPVGVASDGHYLVVGDTDNNRVLIWKNIPTTNGATADIVLGQSDFTSNGSGLSNTAMRGPQGVWIQGTRLFVADSGNHRVMVWNAIPTQNNQPADYVLGEPDFSSSPPPTTLDLPPTASNMFSPVSVTSDGTRLFVADLGHARIMVWNAIPTQNNQPADFALGQPDLVSEADNNSAGVCKSNGTDSSGNATYPVRCYATLSLPRYALSTGKYLFVADGGNDRVLVYNNLPTHSGQAADVVLGQPNEDDDVVTDSTNTFDPNANVLRSSPDTIRTPLALGWDGENLYVTDPYDRRVMVFTPALPVVPKNGITNSASRIVAALGAITFGGTVTATDTITIDINSATYTYTVASSDTLQTIINNIAILINGTTTGKPDPSIVATADLGVLELILTSKIPGVAGNNTTYSVTVAAASSTGTPTETANAAGANLSGGQNAAFVAPGTLVTIVGNFLSEGTAVGVPDANGFYPTKLAGVQVYFDGIVAPLLYVSSTQINCQLPDAVKDSNGVTAFVLTDRPNGTSTSTVNISIPIVAASPGIFALNGTDPRTAIAYHTTSNAISVVSVDGSIQAGDVATISIEDRDYSYTVQDTDSLTTIRDALITLINSDGDEKVTAAPAGQFTRMIITSKVPGPEGENIPVKGSVSTGSLVIVTVLGSSTTCCSSVAGTGVTVENPAVPGEFITIYAAGLGVVQGPDGTVLDTTGQIYEGPVNNTPVTPVDNAQVSGRSANVLFAGLEQGQMGIYRVILQLDPASPTDPTAQMFIAQSVFTSNIVLIPVTSPFPPSQ